MSAVDTTIPSFYRYIVEFKLFVQGPRKLSVPGKGENYLIRRQLSSDALARLFDAPNGVDPAKCMRIWTHRWNDGRLAQIAARVVPDNEMLDESDGFCGYDWMVDNILKNGDPHNEISSTLAYDVRVKGNFPA